MFSCFIIYESYHFCELDSFLAYTVLYLLATRAAAARGGRGGRAGRDGGQGNIPVEDEGPMIQPPAPQDFDLDRLAKRYRNLGG